MSNKWLGAQFSGEENVQKLWAKNASRIFYPNYSGGRTVSSADMMEIKKNMSGDIHMFVFGTRLSNAALKMAIEHIYNHLSSCMEAY